MAWVVLKAWVFLKSFTSRIKTWGLTKKRLLTACSVDPRIPFIYCLIAKKVKAGEREMLLGTKALRVDSIVVIFRTETSIDCRFIISQSLQACLSPVLVKHCMIISTILIRPQSVISLNRFREYFLYPFPSHLHFPKIYCKRKI